MGRSEAGSKWKWSFADAEEDRVHIGQCGANSRVEAGQVPAVAQHAGEVLVEAAVVVGGSAGAVVSLVPHLAGEDDLGLDGEQDDGEYEDEEVDEGTDEEEHEEGAVAVLVVGRIVVYGDGQSFAVAQHPTVEEGADGDSVCRVKQRVDGAHEVVSVVEVANARA